MRGGYLTAGEVVVLEEAGGWAPLGNRDIFALACGGLSPRVSEEATPGSCLAVLTCDAPYCLLDMEGQFTCFLSPWFIDGGCDVAAMSECGSVPARATSHQPPATSPIPQATGHEAHATSHMQPSSMSPS